MSWLYFRKYYLDKILGFLENTNLIKVIVWQRRVWKSFIMKQIIHHLENNLLVNSNNIIYINLEIDYSLYPTLESLEKSIKDKINLYSKDWRIYLLVDEVQEVAWWEKLLNALRADENLDIDIYITWSNSNLLSSDLSTYLSGRFIQFEIWPFSYIEFLEYQNLPSNLDNFLQFINSSGIPELYNISNEEWKISYLHSLLDSIILKDIVKRYNIKDVDLLERLFVFIANNIGNLFSFNSLVKKLKSIWITTNTNTIWSYVDYLEKSFLIHSVDRYDLQWKKILEWEKKYYLNDLWFNNYFSSSFDVWWWWKLENIVYIYLKLNWYQVFVGTVGNNEIDFIAEKWKEKIYIQVAYLIPDNNVRDREFGNLLKIQDNHPKYVLSLDPILLNNFNWIKHINIIDFLVNWLQ